ncbi:phosphatidate cytidylyltransferase [Tepidibacillus fermentans]|uniref:Phosphatidate cytidylyltransferase n=1 Tax=Tepidibacillus fermentans TaxID=1281767 RepID=A0A4R3KHN0_9BACI|nr:phosphatidate cytidylyltransferase [Tepidibacillus fermentans]TCS82975.1 phosphatidate cytidylyltransferase [Tepidibacillus fermentans]
MKKRIITGLVGGIGFLYLVFLGGVPYSLFILVLATIGYYEFLKMNHTNFFSIQGILGLLSVIAIILGLNPIVPFFERLSILHIFIISLWIFLAFVVFVKNEITFDQISILLVGAIYVSFGFGFMLKARLIENGFALTLFVLITTWASDSGAYFSGRFFGKNKLWPEISPKKTIEGSIGGILLAIVAGLLMNQILHFTSIMTTVVLASILVSIVGQIGDLVESALKRSKGVKDSGNLLPGHGGVLDRFDSLIFTFPILFLLFNL